MQETTTSMSPALNYSPSFTSKMKPINELQKWYYKRVLCWRLSAISIETERSLCFRNGFLSLHKFCCRNVIIDGIGRPYCSSCGSWLGSAYSPAGSSRRQSRFSFMATSSSVSFARLLWLVLRSRRCVLGADGTETRPLPRLSLPDCCWNISPCLPWAAHCHTGVRHSLCHRADGLRPSLAEYQTDVGPEIFRVFDELKPNNCLITGTQMILWHGHNGCCLPYAADMDYIQTFHKTDQWPYQSTTAIQRIN